MNCALENLFSTGVVDCGKIFWGKPTRQIPSKISVDKLWDFQMPAVEKILLSANRKFHFSTIQFPTAVITA
jgi:hypothetical protein